jgi:SNF2 family DNA or RNA helicase
LLFKSAFKGAIIGDAMGFGKPFLRLLIVHEIRGRGLEGGPVLIVCPAGLVSQWYDACQLCFLPVSVEGLH